MNYRDLSVLINEIRSVYPIEYERLSAVYPQRVVVLKMLERHPRHLNNVVLALFQQSEEYRIACEYIELLLESYERVDNDRVER